MRNDAGNETRLPRRRFLRLCLTGATGLLVPGYATSLFAFPKMKGKTPPLATDGEFTFAQLMYRGGTWDPEPSSFSSLIEYLTASTSVEAAADRSVVRITDPNLFTYPFLYMAGTSEFDIYQDDELNVLRKYLRYGGTLVGDDCAGTPGYGFDRSFRELMRRLFPENPMARIAPDHTIFRSFFMVRGMGGRKIVSPFLEGVDLGSRTPVIFSPNGLLPAWARDPLGRWKYPDLDGGERQRSLAFQIGVNIVLYALCADYKQDRIHLPFIRKKI